MKISKLEIESKMLNGNVLQIDDIDNETNLTDFEKKMIKDFDPVYVYCKINATDITSLHHFEEIGFRFSEFRLNTSLRVEDTDFSTFSFFPYQIELLSEEDYLEKASKILISSFADDRFSIDPLVGESFSKKRIKANLQKSFKSYPNEIVLGLVNSNTKELIAFRTASLFKDEVFYYQYAVSPKYNFNQFASMLETGVIVFLKEQGIQIINAVTTGFNTSELSRLLTNNFKIDSSIVLLRKVYKTIT